MLNSRLKKKDARKLLQADYVKWKEKLRVFKTKHAASAALEKANAYQLFISLLPFLKTLLLIEKKSFHMQLYAVSIAGEEMAAVSPASHSY
jgi:hypothetical protein